MAYTEDFATNQFKQQPFFEEMVAELSGRPKGEVRDKQAYQVVCPVCKKVSPGCFHQREVTLGCLLAL